MKAAERVNESKLKQKRARFVPILSLSYFSFAKTITNYHFSRLFHLLVQENLFLEKELREQSNLSAEYEFKDRLKKMEDMKRKTDLEHHQFIENKQLQQQL